jgi:hypothetical protein
MTPENNPLYSPERLNRRLIAAMYNDNVRGVIAILALGANPNQAFHCPSAVHRLPDNHPLSITLPLVWAMSTSAPGCDDPFVKALLAAGADVGLCLYWLMAIDTVESGRIVDGILLCEIVHAMPNRTVYTKTIAAWLEAASLKVKAWKEPEDVEICKYDIQVNRRLTKVCSNFGVVHVPEPWVTAELL